MVQRRPSERASSALTNNDLQSLMLTFARVTVLQQMKPVQNPSAYQHEVLEFFAIRKTSQGMFERLTPRGIIFPTLPP